MATAIKLFPYQKEGARFLKKNRFALLADEMGVGKTAQAIEASKKLNRILVICPAVARVNWQKEFEKFSGRFATIQAPLHPITICSYDHIARHKTKYQVKKWDVIICDESHFLKSPTASRTKEILGKEGMIHYAKRFWALTGTPAPNHAGELWTLLFTFGYTKLKYDSFLDRYCNTYRVGNRFSAKRVSGTKTAKAPELKKILSKYMLRRKKSDVLTELPPIFHTMTAIEPSEQELTKKLKTKLDDELAVLKEKIGAFNFNTDDDKILSALQGLSQSISSLRRYHAFSKVKNAAKLIIDEIKSGEMEKCVVFGIHKDVLYELERKLYQHKINTVTITGETSEGKRQLAIESFQNNKSVKVFIGNIQAAGTAITLTSAHHVIFIEQDWVPGNNAQAAMRCHRIGQDKPVTVRNLYIPNELDEKIVSVLTRKAYELATFL